MRIGLTLKNLASVIHIKKFYGGTESVPSWYEKRVTMYLSSFRVAVLLHLCVMKEELHNEQLREWAKHLYTRGEKSLAELSEDMDISEAQLRQWATESSWDYIKKTMPTSKAYQIEKLYLLLEKTNEKLLREEEVNAKDLDLIVKFTAAIKNLDTEISIQQIIEVAKSFTGWLHAQNRELAKSMTMHFDKFIKERSAPSFSS